jgi:hypothetical protein
MKYINLLHLLRMAVCARYRVRQRHTRADDTADDHTGASGNGIYRTPQPRQLTIAHGCAMPLH